MKTHRTALPTLPEPLEARIAPATLIALTDADSLLRFHDSTPGTVATLVVTGLGAGEDLVGIDFRPADGLLYGLTIDAGNAGRLYTLSPVTGAATPVGMLAAAIGDDNPYTALSGTSFGFDFNPQADRLRVVSDTGLNLSINTADARVTTQTPLNPSAPGVSGAAYTNSFPGATSATLYAIDPAADRLATIAPPSAGTFATVGTGLGVNATGVGGFDIGDGKGEAFAALTVGGTTGLYRIDLTTGAATLAGSIGAGTTALRGLAVVQHTWDGDGNGQVNSAANWVAGIVPAAGDSLLFPAGPANKTVFNSLPNLTAFNAIRFTGDGYALSGSSSARVLDGIYLTHSTGTTNFTQQPVFGAQNGASATVDVPAGATLVLSQTALDGSQGVDFTGSGTVDMFSLTNIVNAGTNIVVNGPAVTIDFLNTNRGVALQGGSLSVGKVGGQTRFAPVTVTGGTLLGGGDLGAVAVNGGTVVTDALGITVNGAFGLGAGGTAAFDFPAAPGVFDPIEVKGTVTLAGTLDFNFVGNSIPPKITLIANDGTDAVSGTFIGLAEGATFPLLGRNYTLSYAGGDGNDVTLTGASAPITIAASGKSATFLDVDGDLVTVAITKGTLTAGNFSLRDAGGGRAQLELIDFLGDAAFAGTNLTLTAKRQGANGDGNVNVGHIDATNLDLGAVKIPGDLGAIDAGDATPTTMSIKSLAVHSLGVLGFSTGAPDLESDLDGRVGSIAIRGDLRDAIIDVFDRTKDTGNQGSGSSGDGEAFINSLTIGGNLVGGSSQSSGAIFVRDGILKATIGGSIVGGAGQGSGFISSFDSLGSITIRGSIFGGGGNASGKISATTDGIESLTVLGSVIGGAGPNSGDIDISDFDGERATKSFFLGGSVIGGAGSGSGDIDFAGPVTKATIQGDIIGGSGDFSAQVGFDENGGSFLLGGSVVAGGGNFSAQLDFDEDLGSLTILGSIVGREGTFSAQVEVDDNLGKLTLGGSIIGGGDSSGQLDVGRLKSGTIRGSIIGGTGQGSGQLDAVNIGSLTVGSFIGGAGADSGVLSVFNGTVGTIKVLGSLTGGSGDRSGQLFLSNTSLASLDIAGSVLSGTGATSGSILVGSTLGAVKVGGEIRGTADDLVTITGGGFVPSGGSSAIGIASVKVGGGVTHARILAGYDAGIVGRNADAQIGKVSVGGDWMASSLVAGLVAGVDTFFGTGDDAIGGGGTNDANLTSRIGSVAIKGQVLGTPAAGGGFGIAAQEIGTLKAGPVSFALTANADAFVLGATGDFQARELGAANPVAGPAGPAAALVNDKTVTFTDVDGDLVTVKITKGTLDLGTDFVFAASGVGQQLQRLVLTGAEFAGTAVTITAKRSASGGDGSVNVGFIDAGGVDLGKVTISGDLGSIVSGDATTMSTGLAALAVQSLGAFGTTTGAPNLSSIVNGGAGSVTVRGSVLDATFLANDSTGAGNGKLAKLTLGGSLVGGAVAGSATISSLDTIGSVNIGGSVIGGGGLLSGQVLAPDGFGTVTLRGSLIGSGVLGGGFIGSTGGSAKKVTIGGHILGGDGENSGRVNLEDGIGSILVGGSIIGGGEEDAGSIFSEGAIGTVMLMGDLIGGTGTDSALIDSEDASITSVTVMGSVFGGAGAESANIEGEIDLGRVTIGGTIIGGAGINSASLDADGGMLKTFKLGGSLIGYRGPTVGAGEASALVEGAVVGSVTIGGSVVGGVALNSGEVFGGTSLGRVAVNGSLIGGSGTFSGGIFADGTLDGVQVKGSVIGGAGGQSASIEGNGDTGAIGIGGSVFSGTGALSGAIMSDGNLGKLAIGGHALGNAVEPLVFSGVGSANNALAVAGVSIKGGASFLDMLAGYDDAVGIRADAAIGAVMIGGDLIATNIVAGVLAGIDGFFGTDDDMLIAGGAAPLASIASITVTGQLLGTAAGGDAFGFVAQQIGKLKIGAVIYPLTAGVDVLVLGPTGDFNAREDVV